MARLARCLASPCLYDAGVDDTGVALSFAAARRRTRCRSISKASRTRVPRWWWATAPLARWRCTSSSSTASWLSRSPPSSSCAASAGPPAPSPSLRYAQKGKREAKNGTNRLPAGAVATIPPPPGTREGARVLDAKRVQRAEALRRRAATLFVELKISPGEGARPRRREL
eukprot:219946-Prorocentrum_minimum.AAC.2